MKLRHAELKDVSEIAKLCKLSKKEVSASYGDEENSAQDIKLMVKNKKYHIILIAEEEKEIAGFIISNLWPKVKESFTLVLYVKPKFRNKGIATKLNEKYEQILRKRKINYISSFVSTTNKKMQELKRRLNYEKGKEMIFYGKSLK